MNQSLKGVTENRCGEAASDTFNVVLIYEDQASALRGLALYRRLQTDLGGCLAFQFNLWKFAVLGIEWLAEISAAQAAAANLVIVCAQDTSASPPAQVQAWFNRWLELKVHSNCTVVVLGEAATDQRAQPAPGGFFHDLAQRGVVTVLSPAPLGNPPRELMPQPGCHTPRLRPELMTAATLPLAPRFSCLRQPFLQNC